MGGFNTVDSATVRSFVSSHAEEFHLCALTPMKSCDRSADEVFVILSEIAEMDRSKFGALVLVVDDRSPSRVQRYFEAFIEPRSGDWRMVSFRERSWR